MRVSLGWWGGEVVAATCKVPSTAGSVMIPAAVLAEMTGDSQGQLDVTPIVEKAVTAGECTIHYELKGTGLDTGLFNLTN